MNSEHLSVKARWISITILAVTLAGSNGCKTEAEREAERQTIIYAAKMKFLEDSTVFARSIDSINVERRRQFVAESLSVQRRNDSIYAARQRETDAWTQLQNEQQAREAIGSLEVLVRKSQWIENSYVLQLNNIREITFDLNVRCHRAAGGSKTVFITVPARGMAEVGFQQGWEGNFQPGDWCELMYNTDVIKSVRI